MTGLSPRTPGEQAPPFWWATKATEWFDHGNGEGQSRIHEWHHDGVMDFDAVELRHP